MANCVLRDARMTDRAKRVFARTQKKMELVSLSRRTTPRNMRCPRDIFLKHDWLEKENSAPFRAELPSSQKKKGGVHIFSQSCLSKTPFDTSQDVKLARYEGKPTGTQEERKTGDNPKMSTLLLWVPWPP